MHDEAFKVLSPDSVSDNAKNARKEAHDWYLQKIRVVLADKEREGLAGLLEDLGGRLRGTSLRIPELDLPVADETPEQPDMEAESSAVASVSNPSPSSKVPSKAGSKAAPTANSGGQKKRTVAPEPIAAAVLPSPTRKAASVQRPATPDAEPPLDGREDGPVRMADFTAHTQRAPDLAGTLRLASQRADMMMLPEFSAILKLGASAIDHLKQEVALLVRISHAVVKLQSKAVVHSPVRAGGEGSRIEQHELLAADSGLLKLVEELGLFVEQFPEERFASALAEFESKDRPAEAVRKNCQRLLKNVRQSFASYLRGHFVILFGLTVDHNFIEFPTFNKETKVSVAAKALFSDSKLCRNWFLRRKSFTT